MRATLHAFIATTTEQNAHCHHAVRRPLTRFLSSRFHVFQRSHARRSECQFVSNVSQNMHACLLFTTVMPTTI